MGNLMDMMELGVFALLCFVLAYVLKIYKGRILQYTADLVNKAEEAVQGSSMGAEKKALVIAQLQAAGIRVTGWLDGQIDVIVAALNANGAWLATQTKQHAAGIVGDGEGK